MAREFKVMDENEKAQDVSEDGQPNKRRCENAVSNLLLACASDSLYTKSLRMDLKKGREWVSLSCFDRIRFVKGNSNLPIYLVPLEYVHRSLKGTGRHA